MSATQKLEVPMALTDSARIFYVNRDRNESSR